MWKRVAAFILGAWIALGIIFGKSDPHLMAAYIVFGLGSLASVGFGWLYTKNVLESPMTWGLVMGWAVLGSFAGALTTLAVAESLTAATDGSGVRFVIRSVVAGFLFGAAFSLLNYSIRGPLPAE